MNNFLSGVRFILFHVMTAFFVLAVLLGFMALPFLLAAWLQ